MELLEASVCVYMCTCIHSLCWCVHVCKDVSSVNLCVHTCECMFACSCAWCAHMFMSGCTWYMHVFVSVYQDAYLPMYVHMYTCVLVCAWLYTHVHACQHVHVSGMYTRAYTSTGHKRHMHHIWKFREKQTRDCFYPYLNEGNFSVSKNTETALGPKGQTRTVRLSLLLIVTVHESCAAFPDPWAGGGGVRGWWSLAGPAHYCGVSSSSPSRLQLCVGLDRGWSRAPGHVCETDRVTHSGAAPGYRTGDCNGNIYRAEARGARMAESCQKEQTAEGWSRVGPAGWKTAGQTQEPSLRAALIFRVLALDFVPQSAVHL